MNIVKKFAIGASALAVAGIVFAGCGSSSNPNTLEQAQQRQDSKLLINNQPLPVASRSQERQTLIEIEKAQIQGVQTTSFFFNQGVQNPVKVCPSIGAPIPNTASLSNPLQLSKPDSSGSTAVAQMDPNGVYVPQNSSGTYVLCVGKGGKPYVAYWEGFVQTEFSPAVWNYSTHTIQDIGQPSYGFTKK